jgi:cellulose synthase (UDP-forming)
MLDSFTAHETTSVDILIPTAGEDLDVLANAFGYVAALYWPGSWRVYVLDESGRRDVSGLAARHGFHYLARPDRGRMKKAGNLNYGLRHSGGEFVVVFDADYAPASSFLMHTIPYFTDLATGIVQTPQEFDTDRKRTRSWVQRHSGVVQDMFMSWILPARQAHDSAFCIGSNVAYRRAALTVNGGFPEVETGGEDIVTTWDFIRHGYRTIYIPVNLSKGLCPDTFDASVNQQYRWCLSTLVVVAGSSAGRARRAFWDSPMTRWQRFNFYGGVLYYLQSILGLMLLVAPSLVMLWVYPYRINTGTYLLTMGVMTGMLFMPVILRGWRPSILRFTVVCSVTYMIALWDTVLRSHEGWTPTNGARNKGKTVRRVSTITRAWVVSTQGLAWWGIARDMHVYGLARLWPAVTLTLLQSVVLLPLLLPGYGVSYAPVKNAAAKVSAVLQPRQQLEPDFGAQAEQELDAILDDTDVFPAV